MDYALYYRTDKQGKATFIDSLVNTIKLKTMYLSGNVGSIGVTAVRSTLISRGLSERLIDAINSGVGIDRIKQEIFGVASEDVNLTLNSDIDIGVNIRGEHIIFKLIERYDELILQAEKTSGAFSEQDRIWVEGLNKFKIKHEMAGRSLDLLALNRKLYALDDANIVYNRLGDYEFFEDYKFIGGEASLGEVYLLNCEVRGLTDLKIKHFSGGITNLFSCVNVDIEYITNGIILNMEDTEISVHNISKLKMERVHNSTLHIYNTDKISVISFSHSTVHFYSFIDDKNLLCGDRLGLWHTFIGLRFVFHAGIGFDELVCIIQSMLPYDKVGKKPCLKLYVPMDLQKSVLEIVPKRCERWVLALEDFK